MSGGVHVIHTKTRAKKIRRIAVFVLLLGFVFVLDFPIIFMVLNSLKPNDELLKTLTFLPDNWTFENYIAVFQKNNLMVYIKNSFFLTASSCLIAISASALAGYVLSRYRHGAIQTYGSLLLMLQIFPMILVLIPLFVFFTKLGMLDKHISVILLYTAICVPYSTCMFRAYFDSIGKSLEEAAWIDGCTKFQAFVRIVIPLTWPGFIAVTIYCIILCWNEFMMANLFLRKSELRTLPVVIRSFISSDSTNWAQMMATATIAFIPVFILFIFFQKYMIAGYTDGGTKE